MAYLTSYVASILPTVVFYNKLNTLTLLLIPNNILTNKVQFNENYTL